MEYYNPLDYNQRQLMKRAPTIVTGPSLVFLAPTKKMVEESNPQVKDSTCKLDVNL